MYTKETLATINHRYINCGYHSLTDADVQKANDFVTLIESTRSTTEPKAGDILQYTDEYGEYFSKAHIEEADRGNGYICENAYVPFISSRKFGISCCASGGSWHNVELADMKYVGKAKKRFCFWGSCGACADGAVEIIAEVSVWEYTERNQKTPGYTTKDYDRFFVSDSGENSRYTRETGYRFHVSNGAFPCKAFKDREGLDAWLKTFKAKVFNRGSQSSAIVWTWKQVEKHVSPDEFDAMTEPIDSMMFNGAMRKCKRIYDEANHTVTTCFVWYWDERGDFCKVAARQNKIREEKYTFPWGSTKEFQIARGE